jgi:hypothetical protein
MARPLAVPFALPDARAPRASPLGMPQFVVLLTGVLLVPFIILWLIYPVGLDFLAKDAVLAYRAAFGFDVGAVPTDAGDTDWGITSVTTGGLAERAGLRAGDLIFTHHGTPAGFLHGTLRQAAEGHEGCLEVRNMPARLAGLRLDRTVCFGAVLAAEPIEPACPLPSPRAMCAAPTGGATLVWREPIVANGRHALVLRPADGGPEVLVRAFDRSVDVLWAPDGRAVAITDHDASGESTVWVHWGPLLSHQANLAALIAATGVHFHDRRIVYPPRWEDASTLRLAAGSFEYVTSAPRHRFRYRLGAAAPTPVP